MGLGSVMMNSLFRKVGKIWSTGKKRFEVLRAVVRRNYPAFLIGVLLAASSAFSILSFRQRKNGEVFSVSSGGILGERAGSVSAVATSSASVTEAVVETKNNISQPPKLSATKSMPSQEATPQVKYPINLNKANSQTLDLLPGIGPALAGRIIEFRQTHGAFQTTSQLLDVSGIGEKKFAKIKDLVTVGDE